ncbi:MAG: adhesin [Pseudomonas sp.]
MMRTLLALAMLCSASVFAQPPVISSVPVINNADIDNSGQQYQGNAAVNQAAGDQQQQANARAIANGPRASASTQIRQRLRSEGGTAMDAKATISGNSFSNGNGILGVNQSAGASNQQANAVHIAVSAQPQSLDDSVLMQQNVTLLNSSGSTNPTPGSRQIATSDQAFTGSRGVIQVNQSAGVGNQTANILSVRVSD